MSRGNDTLEHLWLKLGLDSLPADAGTPVELESTRTRDWEDATLKHDVRAPPSERDDLPRISLTPPAVAADAAARHDLRVTGLLGEGGMGRVLLARQDSLGRDVAVKVPRTNASRGTINALLHEARITGALEHPGVIPVYSLATDSEGLPALVMKRVDGVSWSMLLRHAEDPAWGRLAAGGADRLEVHVDILRQVCNAIAFAHKRGILHRDIKPANILIGEFGEVYVADWGVATRKVEPDEVRRASLVGTPVYMAPEMVTGDDALMDERTDVFLLGATLYEVLTGQPPWRGTELQEVLKAAWVCRATPPGQGVPAELTAICGRAMALEPERRFQTALEFRDALTGFLRHRGSVQLARATSERLQTLMASLQSTDRSQVYPLLSECRFGFTQALREWPENEEARQGLRRCLEATAQYELSQGNLEAARALISELGTPSTELREALMRLETELRARSQRQARIEHLSQEMDPSVASRQRVGLFVAMTAVVVSVVVLPFLVPALGAWLLTLGTWRVSLLLSVVLTTYLALLFIGRRALLSTRLNRRLAGIVGVAVAVSLAHRLLAAGLGLSVRDLILTNYLVAIGVCLTGGLTLHWGFYWSAGALAAGAAFSWFMPGMEPTVLGLASVIAFVFAMASWRGWRGEFSINAPDA